MPPVLHVELRYNDVVHNFLSQPAKPSWTFVITNKINNPPEDDITCSNCEACCCRLEVLLISETGVPGRFIAIDKWGGMTMARLADGWCAALDRDTMKCTIYDRRPLVCRDFEMGSHECLVERTENL